MNTTPNWGALQNIVDNMETDGTLILAGCNSGFIDSDLGTEENYLPYWVDKMDNGRLNILTNQDLTTYAGYGDISLFHKSTPYGEYKQFGGWILYRNGKVQQDQIRLKIEPEGKKSYSFIPYTPYKEGED